MHIPLYTQISRDQPPLTLSYCFIFNHLISEGGYIVKSTVIHMQVSSALFKLRYQQIEERLKWFFQAAMQLLANVKFGLT